MVSLLIQRLSPEATSSGKPKIWLFDRSLYIRCLSPSALKVLSQTRESTWFSWQRTMANVQSIVPSAFLVKGSRHGGLDSWMDQLANDLVEFFPQHLASCQFSSTLTSPISFVRSQFACNMKKVFSIRNRIPQLNRLLKFEPTLVITKSLSKKVSPWSKEKFF